MGEIGRGLFHLALFLLVLTFMPKLARSYNAANQYLTSNLKMMAITTDDTLANWGAAKNSDIPFDKKVMQVVSTYPGVYAVLYEDGTVATWGDRNYGACTGTKFAYPSTPGGDVYCMPEGLSKVDYLWATFGAIIARKIDGSTVIWGWSRAGGCPSPSDENGGIKCAPANIKNIRQISSCSGTCNNQHCGGVIALTEDNEVYSWGDRQISTEAKACVALPTSDSPDTLKLTNVAGLVSNYNFDYAGLREFHVAIYLDGSITMWGHGADTYSPTVVTEYVTNRIYSSPWMGFAAVREDGAVNQWGLQTPIDTTNGASLPTVISKKNLMSADRVGSILYIASSTNAFAALMTSQRVFAWGLFVGGGCESGDGGNINSIDYTCAAPDGEILTGVVSLIGGFMTFAALMQDGTLRCWGNVNRGGQIPADYAKTKSFIYALPSDNAMLAITSSGVAVAFGENAYGGCMDLTNSNCRPSVVRVVQAATATTGKGGGGNWRAEAIKSIFAVVLATGEVKVWGNGAQSDSAYEYENNDIKMVIGSMQQWPVNYPKQSCPRGKYGSGMPDCTDCPAGANLPKMKPGINSTIDSCMGCEVGTSSSDGLTCNMKCAAGRYSPGWDYYDADGGNKCFPCPKGRYSGEGSAFCTACERGYYANEEGMPECTVCAAGKFFDSKLNAATSPTICVFCENGKSSPPGATECTDCPVGKFRTGSSGDADAACQGCPTGRYGATALIRESECTVCEKGKFSNITGASTCEPCSLGRYAATTASTECQPCFAGRYASEIELERCDPCDKGTFVTDTAATACEACPEGTFAAYKGLPVCSTCPAGSHSTKVGSKTSDVCMTCKPGTYSFGGANICRLAPPGSYTDKSGATDFVACEAGTFQSLAGQTTCEPTQPGTYSGKGAAVATKCPAGRYCPSAGATSIDNCKLCGAGKYSFEGAVGCVACEAGAYQYEEGMSRCLKCEPGSAQSGQGATSCTLCDRGTFAAFNGSVDCLKCASDSYQPDSGKTECKSCEEVGEYMVGNPERDGCVTDEAYSALAGQKTLIESFFTKGVALGGTGGVAVIFVGVSLFLHRKRTMSPEKDQIGQWEIVKVILGSLLPGFSFGSEIFLTIGLIVDTPVLGLTMAIARSMHFLVGGMLALILFGPLTVVKRLDPLVSGAVTQRLKMNEKFLLQNMPLIGLVVFFSLFDCTMLTFIPWSASAFFTGSRGFPSLGLMKWCLWTKTLQSTISTVCQIYYLISKSSISSPTTTSQAKGLFISNVLVTVMGLALLLLTLVMQQGILAKLQAEEDAKEKFGGGDALMYEDNPLHLSVSGKSTISAGWGSAGGGGEDADDLASPRSPSLPESGDGQVEEKKQQQRQQERSSISRMMMIGAASFKRNSLLDSGSQQEPRRGSTGPPISLSKETAETSYSGETEAAFTVTNPLADAENGDAELMQKEQEGDRKKSKAEKRTSKKGKRRSASSSSSRSSVTTTKLEDLL